VKDDDDNAMEPSSTRYNIEFTFDSDVKCAITIYYFATEEIVNKQAMYVLVQFSSVHCILSFGRFSVSSQSLSVLCRPLHSSLLVIVCSSPKWTGDRFRNISNLLLVEPNRIRDSIYAGIIPLFSAFLTLKIELSQ